MNDLYMNNNFDYSVRVKNGAGWRQFNRVRLMISVGQEYHEGGKLKAVVDWINRNPSINEVHVSVNDTLQRHNYYARGMAQVQADAVALSEGALWVARNHDILAAINAKTMMTRWNAWFETPEYRLAREALDAHRINDPGFDAAIHTDATIHVARKASRGEIIPESQFSHSREYLQEELAVFALQTRKLPAAEVYPGSNLSAAEYLLGKTLSPEIAPLSERYFTRIDFARINGAASAPALKLRTRQG